MMSFCFTKPHAAILGVLVLLCAPGVVLAQAATPKFAADNWAGGDIPGDPEKGCIMLTPVGGGTFFTIYANGQEQFQFALVNESWKIERDPELTFEIDGKQVPLSGVSAPNPNTIDVHSLGAEEDGLEPKLSQGKKLRVKSPVYKFDLSLNIENIDEPLTQLWSCVEAVRVASSDDDGEVHAKKIVSELPNKLSEDDVHSLCRTEDHDILYRVGELIQGKPIEIGMSASELSRSAGVLTGMNTVRQGAYVGDVVVQVKVKDIKLPDGLREGSKLLVEGSLDDTFFWGNAIDNCIISIKAAEVSNDGF